MRYMRENTDIQQSKSFTHINVLLRFAKGRDLTVVALLAAWRRDLQRMVACRL